jgi:hypothetical protein
MVRVMSNGVDGLHEPSVWLGDTISDDIILLVGIGLRYRSGTIVVVCCVGLIWVFYP